MSSSSINLDQEEQCKVMKNGVDVVINNDSDDNDDDQVSKSSRVLLADHFRSNSVRRFSKRAEKVWAASPCFTREDKEDESQKVVPESEPKSEEQVGDTVHLGKSSYFIVDIFEKEIMELGDKVDLKFARLNKFEAVDGGSPRDHHFDSYRCCYSSCCFVCSSGNVEKEWKVLEKELASRDGSRGVSFYVRTYQERKELMRVAVAVNGGDHSLFFFDLKFPSDYPYREPSFYYHPYGLPLSTPEYQKPMKQKFLYKILDVFLHIEEIVLMNTNKSAPQMLDMLKRPLTGFEDFVKGHFRKRGAFILRNLMEEMDWKKERDRNMFFKMYVAFEDNKTYCQHLLNNDLKEELKRYKEREYSSLRDYYNHSPSSHYFPIYSRFDDIKRTSKMESLWSKVHFF